MGLKNQRHRGSRAGMPWQAWSWGTKLGVRRHLLPGSIGHQGGGIMWRSSPAGLGDLLQRTLSSSAPSPRPSRDPCHPSLPSQGRGPVWAALQVLGERLWFRARECPTLGR